MSIDRSSARVEIMFLSTVASELPNNDTFVRHGTGPIHVYAAQRLCTGPILACGTAPVLGQ